MNSENLLQEAHRVAKESVEKNICQVCGEEFSEKNVFSEAGWREVKISGCCEKCFDNMFEDEEE